MIWWLVVVTWPPWWPRRTWRLSLPVFRWRTFLWRNFPTYSTYISAEKVCWLFMANVHLCCSSHSGSSVNYSFYAMCCNITCVSNHFLYSLDDHLECFSITTITFISSFGKPEHRSEFIPLCVLLQGWCTRSRNSVNPRLSICRQRRRPLRRLRQHRQWHWHQFLERQSWLLVHRSLALPHLQ